MKIIAFLLAAFITAGIVNAQSLERAELFKDNGLTEDAKRELILIATSSSAKESQAHAYYLLGSIAIDENRFPAAMSAWHTLTIKFPESKEAKEVAGRLKDFSQISEGYQRESLDNAMAEAYISNGGFWSRGKNEAFMIDTSWIASVDAAAEWYDKAITEFPKSIAARVGYEEKMAALLGWKDAGQYGEAHGLKADFEKYMPNLLATFQSYEHDFPDAGRLQQFRYLIAQAYWMKKDWENSKKWLNLIIERDKLTKSFWGDLAKRRLQKLEY